MSEYLKSNTKIWSFRHTACLHKNDGICLQKIIIADVCVLGSKRELTGSVFMEFAGDGGQGRA